MKNILWILLLIFIFSLSSCETPLSVADIAKMSYREMIEHHLRGARRAVLTVGIVQNGEMSFRVFGENGRELPKREHIYEIGSITKPIVAQLFARAISESRVNLDDQIDLFLDLPAKGYYPTIRRLLTHRSGYITDYYFPFVVSTNFLLDGNPFYGITRRMVLDLIGQINLENRDYPFLYSNFAYAVAGLVLEEVFNEGITLLLNNYLRNDLGLKNTRVGNGRGDLSHYWRWNENNPFIAAGGLVTTITDMMKFAQMQIDGTPSYVSFAHNVLAQVDNAPPFMHIPELGVRVDAIGLGWLIDSVHNIIWHGGGTSVFGSYIGFDKNNGIAVVVLSNTRGMNNIVHTIGSTILRGLQ